MEVVKAFESNSRFEGVFVERKADVYKGLDNRELKLINLPEWHFPSAIRNPKVKEIMDRIATIAPNDVALVWRGTPSEAKRLHSAVWRLIKKHEIGAVVMMRGGEIYLRRLG